MAAELTVIEADDMVPVSAPSLVRPVAGKAELIATMREYQETKDALLQDTDYQRTNQGKFIKKSGYAKLAIAFGVSSQIVRREYEHDDAGGLIGAEFVVRATAPNGRYAEGWGYCSLDEPRFKQSSARLKVKHDLPATAETRARNRAYAALFGHGEVSWDEVDAGIVDAGAPKDEPASSSAPPVIRREPADATKSTVFQKQPITPFRQEFIKGFNALAGKRERMKEITDWLNATYKTSALQYLTDAQLLAASAKFGIVEAGDSADVTEVEL